MDNDGTKRPVKWRRLSSSRLLRIDPEDPCYNFDFLGLPLEIKLLIICRYLSVKDVLSMSLISKDYKQFIDQYFLCKEVELPKCLDDYENLIEKRYVLSLKVDLNYEDHPFKSSRERTLEVVKRFNLSKVKHVSLFHQCADSDGLRHDFKSEPLHSRYRTFMSICPWYAEISEFVFKNSAYVQSVDFTIFKSESSMKAIEVLSSNAPYLKKVTLRSPTFFVYFDTFHSKERVFDATTEGCSLSMIIESLLEKTAITYLELVDFHECSDIWSEPHKDDQFVKGDQLLRVLSKTLKSLILTSYPEDETRLYSDIGAMEINCPNLEEMKIISDSSQRCLYHLDDKIFGLINSIHWNCPNLKRFNDMPVPEFFSYRDIRFVIMRCLYIYCSEGCELYGQM